MVVFSVALQDFPVFQGVFDCNERRIRLLFVSDKEDERFFACEFLIVAHSSDAVVEFFSFLNKFGRGFRYDADKRIVLFVL